MRGRSSVIPTGQERGHRITVEERQDGRVADFRPSSVLRRGGVVCL